MGDNPAGKLLRGVEGVAYWAAVAPALARLPAALGYRIACWRGDMLFRCQAGKRTELARNVRLVLGNELSPAAAQQVVRDWFRLTSCSPVDVKRLRRGARPLRRLVEIRGREHLEAALAAGKGAILCSAHFGSHASGLSVLHASGFPITHIGRWDHNYNYDYRVNYNVGSASHPPSGGSGNGSTPGRCCAIGSGRTSSHGLAGPRSRCRQLPRSAPMRWCRSRSTRRRWTTSGPAPSMFPSSAAEPSCCQGS